MRFRLTYEGNLFATQRDAHGGQRVPRAGSKHAIRRAFHEQLKLYWDSDIVLSNAKASSSSAPEGEAPFILDGGGALARPLADVIADEHRAFDYRWIPLVRRESRLRCFIDVLMLRRDGRSSVFSAGDIDNRVKTLIDCLRMPQTQGELVGNETPKEGEDPFFCLLQDDNLITGFTVETDQLYDFPSGADETYVKLVIGVDIRPYSVGFDNLNFL